MLVVDEVTVLQSHRTSILDFGLLSACLPYTANGTHGDVTLKKGRLHIRESPRRSADGDVTLEKGRLNMPWSPVATDDRFPLSAFKQTNKHLRLEMQRWVVAALICLSSLRFGASYGKVEDVQVPVNDQSSLSLPPRDSTTNGTALLKIPDFEQGGLIFFLHIPKTGGTTIRKNFETLERVDYVFGRNYSVYWDEARRVEDAIQHGTKNKTILFFEVHANSSPSFYRLRKRLERWKDTAFHNGVPVFFFTLLRDPLAYAFSHFSFFHLQHRNPTFERCNATEDNFLRFSLWNPQCQFLFKGEASLRAQRPKQLWITKDECQSVQNEMTALFDWIGSTESLSNQTLPLLSRIVGLPSNVSFPMHKVSKDSGETFGKENVTTSTIDSIKQMSTLDMSMYNEMQQRYSHHPQSGLTIDMV